MRLEGRSKELAARAGRWIGLLHFRRTALSPAMLLATAALLASRHLQVQAVDPRQAGSVALVPVAPLLLPIANEDGDRSYTVDWTDVAGATGYTLEEDLDPAFPGPSVCYTGPDTFLWLPYQTVGTYYYRVRASDAGGDGPWSNVESVSVTHWLPPPSLNPIANPEADGDYTVSWTYVRGAQVYHLDEAAGPDFSAYAHRYVGPDLSFTLTNQPQGYWCYRVRAEGGPGGSADSNLACVWVCPCRSYAPLFQRSGRTQGIPGVRLGLERVTE